MVFPAPMALVGFFFVTLSVGVTLRLWVLRRRSSRVFVMGGRGRRGGRMVVLAVRCRMVIVSRPMHGMLCYLDGRFVWISITSFRCFGTELILFLLCWEFGLLGRIPSEELEFEGCSEEY